MLLPDSRTARGPNSLAPLLLHEYLIFIQDVSWSKELYAENAVLRAHFVRIIYEALSFPEAQSIFIASMNYRTSALTGFGDSFMAVECSETTVVDSANFSLQSVRNGTNHTYSARLDNTPERYSGAGELLPPD